jgi:hypothetical protein
VKPFIQRPLGDTGPDAVLAFVEREAAALQPAQAHPDALGLGRHDTKARVALRVDLRVLLTGLVQDRGLEIVGDRFVGLGERRETNQQCDNTR